MGRVVLVTGVAGDLGRRFARRLAEHPEVDHVIGVDVTPPKLGTGAMQFIRADIRNPVISKVLVREHVDTVVHAGVEPTPVSGRGSMKELNVIGTMQLLAACQQAPELERLVAKSSTAVYGATSRDPAMFTEDMSARRLPSSGYPKDVAEVEGYLRGFARRRPDVTVTTLRMANMIGPIVYSPLTAYLKMSVVPTVFGFNPRLQFVHEHDAHGALERATVAGVAGTFNVAGDGVITLAQALRRLGKRGIPLPAAGVAGFGTLARQFGGPEFTAHQIAWLTYGRGVCNARVRDVLGYEPVYTTEQAFNDFAASVNPGLLNPGRLRAIEASVQGAFASSGANAAEGSKS
jgi:UDP-glucose 4-epimerase